MGEDNPAYVPTAQTQRERASQEVFFETFTGFDLVSAGSSSQVFSVQNTTNNLRFVENLTGAVQDDVSRPFAYTLSVTTPPSGSFEAVALQENLPLSFNPAIPWQPGEVLDVDVTNATSTDTIVNLRVAVRERS